MLKRNEKIAAISIIIITAIVSTYLLVSAYLEALYIREKYMDPGLYYRSESYIIEYKPIILNSPFSRYIPDLESFVNLPVYFNGTVYEEANKELTMLSNYTINSVDKIINRINSFLLDIGLKTNYYLIDASRILEVRLKTPKTVRILDYLISCNIVYFNDTSDKVEHRLSRTAMSTLIISADSGSILEVMFEIRKDMLDTIVYDQGKLEDFVELVKNSSRCNHQYITKLFEKLGLKREYYRLDMLNFKFVKIGSGGYCLANIRGLIIPRVGSIYLSAFEHLNNISSGLGLHVWINIIIIPLSKFNIFYKTPSISKKEAVEKAVEFVRDRLDIPERLLNASNIKQVFYFKDAETLKNYYVVYVDVNAAMKYVVGVYIDPDTGEIHDYMVYRTRYIRR